MKACKAFYSSIQTYMEHFFFWEAIWNIYIWRLQAIIIYRISDYGGLLIFSLCKYNFRLSTLLLHTIFTSYSFYFSFLNNFFDVWGFSGLLTTICWSTKKAQILYFSRKLLSLTIIFQETYNKEGSQDLFISKQMKRVSFIMKI